MLFNDIPGLKAEKQHLLDSVRHHRVSHAQLFYGHPGTMMLPLALAYCQYLVCKHPKEDDSCGQCSHCQQFSSLNYPDLHFSFPFAKTKNAPTKPDCDFYLRDWHQFVKDNRVFSLNDWLLSLDIEDKQAQINVQEAARIVKKLQLKSYSGSYKFMLLYLPEYLHPSAANKLLKTLEEPSDGSVIILLSEDPDRLLNTITSRCQKLYISQGTEEDITNFLISEGVDENTARQSASLCDRSFSEALHLVSKKERYLEYGQLFMKWMRGCYSAKVVEIFSFVEAFSKLGRQRQKEAIKFFLQTLEIALRGQQEPSALISPIFAELKFKLEGFSSVLHLKNGLLAEQVLNEAHRDISRNGNARIIMSDASFKFSNLLRLKAEA